MLAMMNYMRVVLIHVYKHLNQYKCIIILYPALQEKLYLVNIFERYCCSSVINGPINLRIEIKFNLHAVVKGNLMKLNR